MLTSVHVKHTDLSINKSFIRFASDKISPLDFKKSGGVFYFMIETGKILVYKKHLTGREILSGVFVFSSKRCIYWKEE